MADKNGHGLRLSLALFGTVDSRHAPSYLLSRTSRSIVLGISAAAFEGKHSHTRLCGARIWLRGNHTCL